MDISSEILLESGDVYTQSKTKLIFFFLTSKVHQLRHKSEIF